jgi:hypothetical protein
MTRSHFNLAEITVERPEPIDANQWFHTLAAGARARPSAPVPSAPEEDPDLDHRRDIEIVRELRALMREQHQ